MSSSIIPCAEFDPTRMVTADPSEMVTIKGKSLKLIDLKYRQKNGSKLALPGLEFSEGVSLKFPWSAHDQHSRKVCLDITKSPQWKKFLKSLEDRSIQLASELSGEMASQQMDEATVREHAWARIGGDGHIKVAFDPSTCPVFRAISSSEVDPTPMKVDSLPKKSVVYPIICPKSIWYNTEFGVSFKAVGMIVRPAGSREDDFILGDTSKKFTTNRLLREVQLSEDLDFTHDIFTSANGSIMYFFNMRTAEMPRMRAPFGARVDEESGGVSLQVSMSDPKVADFARQVESAVIEGVTSQFQRWFGKQMTKQVLETHIYKENKRVIKPETNPKYPNRLKFKLYTDPTKTERFTEVFVQREDGTRVKGSHADIVPQSDVVIQFYVGHIWFKGTKSKISSMVATLVADRILVYPSGSGVLKAGDLKNWTARAAPPAAEAPTLPAPAADTSEPMEEVGDVDFY